MSALLGLRREHPAFSGGDHRPVARISDGCFAHPRESGADLVSVTLNFGAEDERGPLTGLRDRQLLSTRPDGADGTMTCAGGLVAATAACRAPRRLQPRRHQPKGTPMIAAVAAGVPPLLSGMCVSERRAV